MVHDSVIEEPQISKKDIWNLRDILINIMGTFRDTRITEKLYKYKVWSGLNALFLLVKLSPQVVCTTVTNNFSWSSLNNINLGDKWF